MGRGMCQHRRGCAFVLALGMTLLSGCKVLTVDDDRALRARRGGDFDAVQYVDGIWEGRVIPALDTRTVAAENLVVAMDANLSRAGARYGRRVAEGSAWTFVVSGTGVVSAVDLASRHGQVDVALTGAPRHAAHLQVGPVVSGTAIRDALPFVAFNNFADQLVFADVGRALTRRALAGLRPSMARLQKGQAIRFLGVANVRDAGEPLVIIPVSISAN